MIKKFKMWWSEQYVTDQAAMMSIAFGLIILIIGMCVIVSDL